MVENILLCMIKQIHIIFANIEKNQERKEVENEQLGKT